MSKVFFITLFLASDVFCAELCHLSFDGELNISHLESIKSKEHSYRKSWKKLKYNDKKHTWFRPEKLKKRLGQGYNADVFLSDSKQVFKIPIKSKYAHKMHIEYLVNRFLLSSKYRIHVDQIISHGENFSYLEKEYLDSRYFASEILKSSKLSSEQLKDLKKLFLEARRFSRDTGIGLDIKSENLFWNFKSSHWVLFDCGPRMSYKTFGYTTDLLNFKSYLREWVKEEPGDAE